MTSMPNDVGLAPQHYAEISRILAKYRPLANFYAFGSRVTGRARRFSDLDILMRGDGPMTIATLGAIEHDFCESRLPFRVDVVDSHRVSRPFLAAIAADLRPI